MEIKLTPELVTSQLSNPRDEIGRAVGDWMAKNNLNMSKTAYQRLQVNHRDTVLEIGPGNGSLVGYLVTEDNKVTYKGIDISETMIEAAKAANKQFIRNGQVEFEKSAAEAIPFGDASFDRVVSVNCIYFWDLIKAVSEIYRVLKPGGRVVIASLTPATMKAAPLLNAQAGFRNLDLSRPALEHLFSDAGFGQVEVEDYSEDGKRVDGTPIVRRAYVTIATK